MSLNVVWFVLLVIIVAGYLIMDGFDLGVGILHMFLAKDDRDRRVFLNSIGPVWDGNEVWLILAGGVLFAAFPMVYASLFSGFYGAMMLVLLVLILRTVAGVLGTFLLLSIVRFSRIKEDAALGIILFEIATRYTTSSADNRTWLTRRSIGRVLPSLSSRSVSENI